jgi:hypothetical protein
MDRVRFRPAGNYAIVQEPVRDSSDRRRSIAEPVFNTRERIAMRVVFHETLYRVDNAPQALLSERIAAWYKNDPEVPIATAQIELVKTVEVFELRLRERLARH